MRPASTLGTGRPKEADMQHPIHRARGHRAPDRPGADGRERATPAWPPPSPAPAGSARCPARCSSADDIRHATGRLPGGIGSPGQPQLLLPRPARRRPGARWTRGASAWRPTTPSSASTRTSRGPSTGRAPFDEALTEVVEELAPPVVSFHFGLPADDAGRAGPRRPAPRSSRARRPSPRRGGSRTTAATR